MEEAERVYVNWREWGLFCVWRREENERNYSAVWDVCVNLKLREDRYGQNKV
jgi:hypothetical protein